MISTLDFLKTQIAGAEKKLITIKFNEYVPITEIKFIKSRFSEKLKTIKFQGKPVKIFPLINSVKPNSKENKKKALITFLNLIK